MTEECKPILNTGLRGITIASTRISDVRGTEGKLIYRGYLVQDLAANIVPFKRKVYEQVLAEFAPHLTRS